MEKDLDKLLAEGGKEREHLTDEEKQLLEADNSYTDEELNIGDIEIVDNG